MTTPPPPPLPQPVGNSPGGIAPSIVKETRGLLMIAGLLLCLLGVLTLCGGGFTASMAVGFPLVKSKILESAASATSSDRDAIETLTKLLHGIEPFLGPLIATTVLTTLATAFLLIGLGIGTLQARRWARKLLLASGWAWCGLMVIQFVCFLVMLPGMNSWENAFSGAAGAPSTSPGAMASGLAFQVIFNLVAYAGSATPGIALILIFGLRNVRLTCEQLDPGPNWTDRIPIQVLPFLLILTGWFLQAVTLLPLLPASLQACRSLGLSVPAYVFPATMAATACLGVSIWLMSRMHPLSWWLVFIENIAAIAVICLFHLNTDFADLLKNGFSLLPLPDAERAQLGKELTPERLQTVAQMIRDYWIVVATPFAIHLGLLVWMKKYFRPDREIPGTAQG